jgi:hypothetical protein
MYGIASVIAPLLGGVFTTKLTWRLCFYINLPIGGSTLLSIALFFHPPPNALMLASTWQEKFSQMDLLGVAILIPGIICFLLALQWAGSVYKWSSSPIIALLVISALAAVVFISIQIWKKDNATVPPRIIKQRSVACSACYVFHAGGALNVFQYYVSTPHYISTRHYAKLNKSPNTQLPIWFQAIQGVSAFDSGIRILPTTLGTVLFSLIAGIGVSKTGYYTPFMILGASLSIVGACLIATWQVASPPAQWIGYQILFSAGAGLGIQQAHTAAQTVLAATDVPTGAVIVIFAQILGGTVWLSIAQNVLTGQLLRGVVDAVPGLNPEIVLKTGATALRDVVAVQFLDRVLEVYNFALTRTFYCGVGLAAVALVAASGMEWRSIKKASSPQ